MLKAFLKGLKNFLDSWDFWIGIVLLVLTVALLVAKGVK